MQAAAEGLPGQLDKLIQEQAAGWQACEAQLQAMTQDRDTWRRKAKTAEAELHANIEKTRVALAEVLAVLPDVSPDVPCCLTCSRVA